MMNYRACIWIFLSGFMLLVMSADLGADSHQKVSLYRVYLGTYTRGASEGISSS